jgi:hypothetical protein
MKYRKGVLRYEAADTNVPRNEVNQMCALERSTKKGLLRIQVHICAPKLSKPKGELRNEVKISSAFFRELPNVEFLQILWNDLCSAWESAFTAVCKAGFVLGKHLSKQDVSATVSRLLYFIS